MANYFEMSKDQLRAEKAALEQSYAEFKAKGLKLNMARGKPGPHQMDLAMDLLKMSDYTTEDGYDARNYGNLEGLEEARALFGDVMGVKSSEVFVGGNSSLQLMYNLISMGHTFGFPESPCPWSQVEHRKFLCPAPGYDRHFKITEEFGFELITIPMTPDGKFASVRHGGKWYAGRQLMDYADAVVKSAWARGDESALDMTRRAMALSAEPSLFDPPSVQEEQNALQYRYDRLKKKAAKNR